MDINTLLKRSYLAHYSEQYCAICLEVNTTLFRVLECSHVFHVNCIDIWFSRRTTCPICRYDLLTQRLYRPRRWFFFQCCYNHVEPMR